MALGLRAFYLKGLQMNLYSAICDYERAWSEPPKSDEEYEEMLESRLDYEEHMTNMAGER